MTEPPILNRADAEQFLSALDPDVTQFSFQVFDDYKERAKNYKKKYKGSDPYRTAIIHGSLEKCWSDLVTFSARGCGIFVTINRTDLGGRAAANVTHIRSGFVDLDAGGSLPTFHRPPHIVVESSPGKWHVYWRVKDCGLDQFEALQKRLLRHYGADPKITDRSRVLRLPGFPHQKAEPFFLTRLVEARDHDCYTVETLVDGLAEVSETEPDDDGWSEQDESKTGPKAWTSAEEAKLRSALAAIPVDEESLAEKFGDSHEVFINIGRAIERLGWGRRGFKVWRDWCAQSDQFDEGGLRVQWASFARTRGGAGKKVTVGTIYHYAKAFGWRAPVEERAEVEPTYPDEARTSGDAARAELERLIETFFDTEPNWWEQYGGVTRCVHAVQASTGIGKTQIAARVIACRIRDCRLAPPVGYSVPLHRLGEKIAEQFREHGITAEVWRGRAAHVSGEDGPTMCADLGAVEIARDLGMVVETAVCRGKDPAGRKVTCGFYHACLYQRQKTREPDVWIFAHEMLFLANKTLAGLSALFIDEEFRDAGTAKSARGLTLDQIDAVPPGHPCPGELGFFRERLAGALRALPHTGGVPRKTLTEWLTIEMCDRAIKLEWMAKEKPAIWPGMPARERAAAKEASAGIRHIRTLVRVWKAARELLERDDVVVSGRLFLATHKTENGAVRVVRTRGVREVKSQYIVPTFIMDATLPSISILEKWFPHVEVVGQIEVPMPHTTVTQVLGAPVSQKKLDGARNLKAVRRYILREWIRTRRGRAVVIMQQKAEAALRTLGLPPEIATEHFNNIEGLDEHKDVRLLVTVGRTQPRPEAVEADAGALSGVEPVMASVKANQSTWYDKVTRGIRLPDGRGVAVSCDQHPDPLAEDVRRQVCEAELVQAIGRGRGVNRTAENPLDVRVLADVVLPITVDVVSDWDVPGLEICMVAEGIWLESPADMARAWPEDWPTEMAAKNWLRGKMVCFPLIEYYQGKLHHLRYHPAGVKQRWRTAWVDPAVVPDAHAWLESRLGPLAGFELVEVCFVLKAEDFNVGGLDFATPAVFQQPDASSRFLPNAAATAPAASVQEKPPWSLWPTPTALAPFVTREEIEAFWALPLAEDR
jgi:hypothetical protein